MVVASVCCTISFTLVFTPSSDPYHQSVCVRLHNFQHFTRSPLSTSFNDEFQNIFFTCSEHVWNALSAIVRKCTTCWKAWVGNNSILRDRESWGGDLSSVNLWRFDGRGGVGGGQLLGFASVTVEKDQTLSINFSGDGVWKVIPRRLMIQAWCCWLKAQAVMSLDG